MYREIGTHEKWVVLLFPTLRRASLGQCAPDCGGRSEAKARNTVFLEIPNCRATARADSPSIRCIRRISAQSSTLITSLPPDPRQ